MVVCAMFGWWAEQERLIAKCMLDNKADRLLCETMLRAGRLK